MGLFVIKHLKFQGLLACFEVSRLETIVKAALTEKTNQTFSNFFIVM